MSRANLNARAAKVATLLAIASLAACSDGGSSSSSLQADGIVDPVLPVQSFVVADIENVQASALTAIDADAIVNSGLTNAFFNTQLNCPDGWQSTAFSFDSTSNQITGELCDGTSLSADYSVVDGVVAISAIALDGQPTPTAGYEYWGLLAEDGSNEQWRACYYRAELENDTSIPIANLLPPVSGTTFDCSEDAYLFYDAGNAAVFIAKQ